MGSLFDTLMEEIAAPILFENLGDENQVCYRPPGGGAESLMTAILPQRSKEIEELADGQQDQRARRQVIITPDPDGTYGGVAEPKLDGTFEIDGEEWAIESIDSQTNAIIRCTCVYWRKRKVDHYEQR